METPSSENSFAFWRTLARRDPATAARTVLARIAALSPEHRRAIWATVPNEATLTAEFARGVGTNGRLAGVPFAVKDLFAVAGQPTGAGSTFLAGMRGTDTTDAPIVAHLRAAGAVMAGKVHLHEFAYGLTGENPHFGDGPNLRHPGRVSGGSSSGSVASIAGGIVPLALGTDTGGSIRVPTAFNGLWGFRGRPQDKWTADCFPLSQTFDTAGWFTARPTEMQEVQRLFFGTPAPANAPKTFARIDALEAVPTMEPAEAAALDRVAAALAQPLQPDELEDFRRALEGSYHAYVVVQSSEAAAIHAAWLDDHRADYDPAVWARINNGRKWTTAEIAAAHAKRMEVRAMFARLFDRYAGVMLPAAPFPALRKIDCTDENRARVLQLTNAASHAGAPVLTIPVRLDNGLSNGLQVVLPDYHTAALETLLADRASGGT